MPDQAGGGNQAAFCGFRHELLADRSEDRLARLRGFALENAYFEIF